ncbi:hypothetical protein lerEdw1_003946 [Lerista edwardsae]|nr:hypothetical protein lerEdw1_003946 [Lerista edwardsae]
MGQQSKDVQYVNSEYGKNGVRILYIRREGKIHCIKELEISVHLRLNTVNEYMQGDNSCVIPTDTIKNTIEAMAKCRGIRTIEEFGLDLCDHFITSFCHVMYCNAFIQEVPWQRLEKDGIPHAHAFLYSSEGVRFCEIEEVEVILSNIHYSVTNLEKLGLCNDKEILTPTDTPFGACATTLRRRKACEGEGPYVVDCKPRSIGWKSGCGVK